jgi:DNA-binding SARP family transcriptional activator
MIAACATVTVGLWSLTGPPTMLTSLPDWSHIRDVMTGSRLSDQDVITVTIGIAWVVVAYLLLSIVVRLALGLAGLLTGQAAWVRSGLRITAPLTLPIVRRVVDGALAGTILFSATFHTPSAAFASPAAITASVEAPLDRYVASFDGPAAPTTDIAPALSAETVPATYSVVRGDHLWGIAERFLGDGFRWVEIWKLNQQRTMSDGRAFVDPNLIYPGWQLELPQDVDNVEPEPLDEEEGLGVTPEPEPTPEPSPVPPTPDPTGVIPTPTPTVAPGGPVAPPDDGGSDVDLRPSLPSVPAPDAGVVAAAAAITVGGIAMLLVFRRARQRWHSNGRHERRPAGSGDAARVLATSTALLSALSELDFASTSIVLVRESDRYLEFTLDCPPGDAEALVESRYAISRQLGGAVDCELVGVTTVRLKLSRMSQLAAALLADAIGGEQPLLVPVGASDSGIHYLNLAAVGSVLVAGRRMEGRDLLTSWFTTLDSLHPEGTVAVVADEAACGPLGDCLELLPGPPDDADPPADSPSAFARWLETKLITRDEELEHRVLLALLGPSPDPASAVAEMEGVLRQGPGRGIFVIAFADTVEGVDTRQSFGSSVVFGEDEQSGAITLTLPHVTPLHLEPVVVRRQVAHRPRRDTATPVPLTPESPAWAAPQNGHAPLETWPDDDEKLAADDDEPRAPELIAPPSENGRHPVDAATAPEVSGATPLGAMDRQASLPLAGPNGESAAEDGPAFRARLFGTFRVETDASEVDGWSIQKARELLAYLLAHGGTPVLRDTAAEALGLSGENQGGHPLPNAAYYVRRTLSRAVPDLEGDILITARQRYALRAGLFRTDVDTFDAHLARAERLQGYEALVEYQRALELCSADFLADEDYEWAEAYRRDYQKRFNTSAHRAAKLACELRDPKLALRFYDAILQRDPIDEEAVREAMRSHAAMGDRNSAKRLYKKLIEDLRAALDDEQAVPMPETTKVVEELADRRSPTG